MSSFVIQAHLQLQMAVSNMTYCVQSRFNWTSENICILSGALHWFKADFYPVVCSRIFILTPSHIQPYHIHQEHWSHKEAGDSVTQQERTPHEYNNQTLKALSRERSAVHRAFLSTLINFRGYFGVNSETRFPAVNAKRGRHVFWWWWGNQEINEVGGRNKR